jgi:ankyrin repeat protein
MNDIIKYVKSNDLESVKRIIDVSNITSIDSYGDTLLHMAVLNCNLEIAKILVNNKIDLNAQNYQGKTPLHYAAEYNCIDIAAIVIKNKGDLHIEDNFGNEPLWTAVFEDKGGKRVEFVKLLLLNGANKNHKNRSGISPLDFAKKTQNFVMMHLLQQK